MTMQTKIYRVLKLTTEGTIRGDYDIKAADDVAAMERAQQFASSYPTELWLGPRRIARYEPGEIDKRKPVGTGRPKT
jgi:hypothetical protein